MVWSFFTWISKEILKWDSKALLSLPFLRASLSFQRPMVRSLKIPNLSNFVDERIKVFSGGGGFWSKIEVKLTKNPALEPIE